MTWAFESFQAHCHEFLAMMGPKIIFRESIFIFSFVIMDW
jgi:hypothetical protein